MKLRLSTLRIALALWGSCWGGFSQIAAKEVQNHGLIFEHWVCDSFFDGYRPPNYTQKWDVPAEINRDHGGVPVNPKAIKYGTSIDLGDALRQYDIDESFILLVGYWQQEGEQKRFVKIVAPVIHPEVWRLLWGSVTREDLARLDELIKDRDLDYREARKQAQAMKKGPPFNESLITLNPKIDSKGQRRLQCSLRFDRFFSYFLPTIDPAPENQPQLWGAGFPRLIESAPRVFDLEPQAEREAGGREP